MVNNKIPGFGRNIYKTTIRAKTIVAKNNKIFPEDEIKIVRVISGG